MRAREFVTEARDGKLSTRNRSATVGLNLFSDGEKVSGSYTLNRVMMAAAMADGSGAPIDMDAKSWVGKKSTASPYTKIEQEMLKQAYRAAGASYEDLNKGDLDSEEHPAVNTVSPIIAFQGYPR
jgi:hypothetical protein